MSRQIEGECGSIADWLIHRCQVDGSSSSSSSPHDEQNKSSSTYVLQSHFGDALDEAFLTMSSMAHDTTRSTFTHFLVHYFQSFKVRPCHIPPVITKNGISKNTIKIPSSGFDELHKPPDNDISGF
jgi:hypothetical protein